jgi:hypothetical protein
LRSIVERTEWPDVRLNERMAAVDNTFERIDLSLQRLEDEMGAMRSELGNEMRAMRGELTAEIHAINHRLTLIGFGLAGILAAGLITTLAT